MRWGEKKEEAANGTNAFWKRFVPVALWLASEHRRAEQVKARVAVIEDDTAKCEVPVFNLTLPDRVGQDTWIRAVNHCVKKEKKRNAARPSRIPHVFRS